MQVEASSHGDAGVGVATCRPTIEASSLEPQLVLGLGWRGVGVVTCVEASSHGDLGVGVAACRLMIGSSSLEQQLGPWTRLEKRLGCDLCRGLKPWCVGVGSCCLAASD